MILLCFMFGLLIFCSQANKDISNVCKPSFYCSNVTMQSSEVIDFCLNKNATITNRCCLNQNDNNTIIGIDFSSCNLKKFNDLVTLIRDANKSEITIEIVDVRKNSIEECSKNDFTNFIKLDAFYFSNNCSCPGSNYSWSSMNNYSCIGQINICNTNYARVNCTPESYCSPNGPGNFLCLCKEGFHGYKCLNEGRFPTLTFTLVACLGTLFLCGLLYHTQRRHVKKD